MCDKSLNEINGVSDTWYDNTVDRCGKKVEMRSLTMLSEVNGEVEGDVYPTMNKFWERRRYVVRVY